MKVLSLVFCLLVLNSCASTPQSSHIRSNGLDSLPSTVELTETPFYPQTQYQCGPAALATVLQSNGVEASPEKLSSQVYIPDRKGSLQIEMTAAARRHGMFPYQLEPSLTDLLTEIEAGNPVLVLQNLGFEWYPNWHYAVVVGYDIENEEIILRSGTTRRWVTSFEAFERTWQRADFWALVIVPISNVPDTARPLPYLKTVYAFEETGKQELAFAAYQAASQRWPDTAVIWMALGNSAFANQNLVEAIRAFSMATSLEPELIASWNNLAYALDAYGCGDAAQKALLCGLKVAPDDNNLNDSMRDLKEEAAGNSQVECPVIQCD
jgi:tetratricopeptide (TPR) repeat protein